MQLAMQNLNTYMRTKKLSEEFSIWYTWEQRFDKYLGWKRERNLLLFGKLKLETNITIQQGVM